jgi:hypothetical protein
MTASLALMMLLLAQADRGAGKPTSASKRLSAQIFGPAGQVPPEPREKQRGCHAVLLSRRGFQLASAEEVSRAYPISELSQRLKAWKASELSLLVIFAREHRLKAQAVEAVIDGRGRSRRRRSSGRMPSSCAWPGRSRRATRWSSPRWWLAAIPASAARERRSSRTHWGRVLDAPRPDTCATSHATSSRIRVTTQPWR